MRVVAARFCCFISLAMFALAPVRGDGPADNHPNSVRRIPKLGVELPAERKAELEASLKELDDLIAPLAKSKDAKVQELLPDIRIYSEAVRTALAYQEFFDVKETGAALELLAEGKQRAQELAAGRSPWTTQTGLVVRGYVSKIDGSVQPYGLVVPESYTSGPHRWRLDFWFHGRGETLSEVNFLQQRRKQIGIFAPEDTIVLHPYGRYSNANKFAGETDVFEALASVKRRYKIDDDRISVRGFSMGGASTWHLAVHFPTLWAAANPGAGFSETPDFLLKFQNEELKPTWYERKLWHLYDCTDWAVNLYHCPTVAYSGEIDRQKQAADIMAEALRKEGLELTHIIGPKTAHSYEPGAKAEVERRINSIIERRPTSFATNFTTYTLKYNSVLNLGLRLSIDGLEEHWRPARVNYFGEDITTTNVSALTLEAAPGRAWRGNLDVASVFKIDGQEMRVEAPFQTDRSFRLQVHKEDGTWKFGPAPVAGLVKRHGLQGPIDDAFMDSFIFVKPSGKCRNELVEAWSKAELERAVEHWRRHFRGHARVKLDSEITDADVAGANLVLWGDDQANGVWAKIADKLPLRYAGDQLVVGEGTANKRTYDAAHHAPIQIYPNPLNPDRYVVTNSSFTFREYAYLNNARQVPMLPDWAVVDLRQKPDAVRPGKIAEADFFGEKWEVRPPHAE